VFSPSLPGAFFVLVLVVVLVLDSSRFTPFFEYEDEDRFAEDEDDLIPSLLLSCFSSPQNVALLGRRVSDVPSKGVLSLSI
jgi:hypothetical protein